MKKTFNKPRIVIAAPRSGSGKTLITCALLNNLKDKAINVVSYKCGPDYIDPLFHKNVIGIPSKNLDLFFLSEEKVKALFCEGHSENDELSIIEGVMGLYDGIGGITDEASTYHLAKTLNSNIILVIDAHGMARSVIAEIKGFLSMDENNLIKGVILNNISKGLYDKMKPCIESETGIKLLGFCPKIPEIKIDSRYLGLKLPNEISNIKEMLKKASKVIEDTIDIDGILKLARENIEIYCIDNLLYEGLENDNELSSVKKIDIAVARDDAFCFYYEDNIRLLEKMGAKITYFSPIKDSELPKNISGLILGGGYPELYAKELSNNKKMLISINNFIKNGGQVLAECGGFMYLHERIVTKENEEYEMVGAINGKCFYTGRLVRFGYVSVEDKKRSFLTGNSEIKAHEFHYYDSTSNGNDCISRKPASKICWECNHVSDNMFAGFSHLYYLSNPDIIKKYLRKCEKKIGKKD